MSKKSPLDSVVARLETARVSPGSPLEFSRQREALLAEGVNIIAGECGIKLRGPLHFNANGEFPVNVEHPTEPWRFGSSPCGEYGEKFAALLSRHGIRFGQQESNHVSPTNGWGWMNHFAAERMVLAYHAEAGEISGEQPAPPLPVAKPGKLKR